MARKEAAKECPRCGAEQGGPPPEFADLVVYTCGSYYDSKGLAKRLGLKWDGRLRVGPGCNPKAKLGRVNG